MKKIFMWIINKRVLDGYVGILGIVLFYKVLALYSHSLSIVYLELRGIFSFEIAYNMSSFLVKEYFKTPWSFRFKLFGFSYNSATEANNKISESVKKSMQENSEKRRVAKEKYPEIANLL